MYSCKQTRISNLYLNKHKNTIVLGEKPQKWVLVLVHISKLHPKLNIPISSIPYNHSSGKTSEWLHISKTCGT